MASRELSFGLVCLVMAAFCGLVGFVVVYHYATLERPIQSFAIVVDAGSTQTRSSLYAIRASEAPESRATSLSDLIQVRQVSSCVNGGPLASVSSELQARALLVDKCLVGFARQIKRLEFVLANGDSLDGLSDIIASLGTRSDSSELSDADEVTELMERMSRRVDSLSELHVGATAGMRALRELNATRTQSQLGWIRSALELSNQVVSQSARGLSMPFINTGYVGILEGADEAAFGWTSANFVCNLMLASGQSNPVEHASRHHRSSPLPGTVATIELGGNSAQLAYEFTNEPAAGFDDLIEPSLYQKAQQNPNQQVQQANISSNSPPGMQSRQLDLFGSRTRLATRSDLCLGMSQAVLRAHVLLLARHVQLGESSLNRHWQAGTLELTSPCLQRNSRSSWTGAQLRDMLAQPCMLASQKQLAPTQPPVARGGTYRRALEALANNVTVFRLVGSGEPSACATLLEPLLEPAHCAQHFRICPQDSAGQAAPPAGTPVVTISGYNKALQVLDLTPVKLLEPVGVANGRQPDEREYHERQMARLELVVASSLGGRAIEHGELVNKTRDFCALDVSELALRQPQLAEQYRAVNCLQLVYIERLLVRFYGFEPQSSWRQIKFLLFAKHQSPLPASGGSNWRARDTKNDIGWTLGLLLNATSSRLTRAGPAEASRQVVMFHHGASVMFVLRATVFVMLSCVFIAVALIVAAGVLARRRRLAFGQCSPAAYISHSAG